MNKKSNEPISFEDYLGCFGSFNIKNSVCKKFCALRLRCAIEHDQKVRMELLEELAAYDNFFLKMQ
jgi:hypothetical protein